MDFTLNTVKTRSFSVNRGLLELVDDDPWIRKFRWLLMAKVV